MTGALDADVPVWVQVGAAAALRDGATLVATARGWSLLLLRDGDAVHAVENRCTHAATRLDTGRLKRCVISCPLHGARFDLRDGSVLRGPATRPLAAFEARINGDDIEVALPERPAPAGPKAGAPP
ncbi:MAG TPA: Rieske 2Fe-2S domain-containing protein [Pseudomonadales bacterium]|nr:Rieske 2Fe-2S domain-containing protein [Pseudomonadales bacterium]